MRGIPNVAGAKAMARQTRYTRGSMPRRQVLTAVLALFVLALAFPVLADMELATNFWDISWSKPGDCFMDWQNVKGENPWNPRFLKEIAIYRALRFMDWDETNNSTRTNWSQRNQKDNPRQNPVAYEWMMDLCNREDADMWVNVPHPTINRDSGDQPCDYALRLCILVKTGVDMKDINLKPMMDGLSRKTAAEFVGAGGVKTCEPLKPTLKLYLEYSNETWNGFMKVWDYVCDEGTALRLDPDRKIAGYRFHAWAAARLFRAANLVFGDESKRVVRVLNAQSGVITMGQQYLKVLNDPMLNPWKLKADAIATAPYFGQAVDGAAPDAEAKCREAIQVVVAQTKEYKTLADAAGVRLIAYEGGQSLFTNAQILNRKPVMHDLYMEYLVEMSHYFDLFAHYNHVGQAGSGGAWGALEFTGQPATESAKFRALTEWSKAHPPQKAQP